MTQTAEAPTTEKYKVRWWVKGDWNGLFGLGTNVLLNVIVLTGLVLFVVQLPDDVVFARILPPSASPCRSATSGTRSSPGASRNGSGATM